MIWDGVSFVSRESREEVRFGDGFFFVVGAGAVINSVDSQPTDHTFLTNVKLHPFRPGSYLIETQDRPLLTSDGHPSPFGQPVRRTSHRPLMFTYTAATASLPPGID